MGATELIGENMYYRIFTDIYQSRKLRRMILSNTNDIGLRKTKVTQYVKKYHHPKRRKRLKSFLKNFLKNKEQIRQSISDDIDLYLFELIIKLEESLKISNQKVSKQRWKRIKYKIQYLGDLITIESNKYFSHLSGGFGNLVGAIKWRKGYLSKNIKAISLIKSKLKPFDIMVEKTPFILTDFIIPGHFGHIALYIGTPEQLKDLDMWDHPEIIKYHDDIKSGKTVLEATRDGVRLTNLNKFLNVDEVAILRTKGKSKDALRYSMSEVLSRSIAQIGKSYDFNFDVESSDEIVCSELIYQSYYFIDWKVEKTMGRWTISPDNIVQNLFEKDPKIELVLYLKGYIANKYKKLSLRSLKRKVD